MKKIRIKIPDNLSPEEEAVEIGQRLVQKALSGSATKRESKRIGDFVEIKELETNIIIERVSHQKNIELVKCNVCGCDYQSDLFKSVWHNYGGKHRKIHVCSESCQKELLLFLGKRASIKRKDLKPLFVK